MRPRDVDLLPGEKVRWSGLPRRLPVFNQADLLLVPFSMVWFGFSVYWTSSVVSNGAPLMFIIFGSISVAIGLYICLGRLVLRWLRLRTTAYTVTSQRIIVTSRLFGRPYEQSSYLIDLPPPVVFATGTIGFGDSNLLSNSHQAGRVWGTTWGTWDGNAFRPVLVEVEDARRVRKIIASARIPDR